ncbi:CDP-alcohol phosphatidyltransferase family protein [Candidatus Falkowbacteria bacterium]|jgi:CDP-diacylglycerol---glycerol-3-phosphate 3-phosphatidyltransferase|nr:CDP-alcohol phosphatidyltransferase family protein [Candidatus Falkowbacteria bacterium]MBT4433378.1 CDP-alcohol phosphatidyltransferase family protein [Candidatus Falkowbacteria bacterium]
MNNENIELYPQDKILEKTILRLIPKKVTPNHVTILRFLLTPLVVWAIIEEKNFFGFFLFLFTASTDAIDGAMARTRKQITEWGKIYDPVADKLLIGSAAFLLISKYLNFYLALAIISIEILLIVNGGRQKINGGIVEANNWGKTKMILQVAGVGFIFIFLLTKLPFLIILSWVILVAAIITGLISLFTYSI